VKNVNYFQISKYLHIFKIIGDSNNPISYAEIKQKSKLANSFLSRGLNWLQQVQTKDSLKKEGLNAYNLEPNEYIQRTGKKKSKNNAYKLTKIGVDLYNSIFRKEEEISFVDEIIQEYKIYEKLWDFVLQNEEIFLDRIDPGEPNLEPWTQQLFEFFEGKDEESISEILEQISGPQDLRLYRFFELLSSLILTHPLWKKEINISSLSKEDFLEVTKIPQIEDDFHAFGTYPECFWLYKSDKLIISIEFQLKG